jgi:hypothetical protein
MARSSRIVAAAGHHAADRVYELVSRLRFLLRSLPPIPDAFSPDDLPISFILKRDSPRNNGRRGRRHNKLPVFRNADGRSRSRVTGRRPEARSTLRPGRAAACADGGSRCHLRGSRHSNRQAS